MKIPEFKLVKPSDNLRKYLEMDEISHTQSKFRLGNRIIIS